MLRIPMIPQGSSEPPPPPDGPPLPGGALPLPPQAEPKVMGGGKYDAEKVKPETAGYQEGPPPQCGACHHFDGKGSCEIVAGPINPQAWCCLFEASLGDQNDSNAPPTGTPEEVPEDQEAPPA